MNNKKFISYSLYIYAAIIFILSQMPFKSSGTGFAINDKIIHFIEYSILGYLLIKYFSINMAKGLNSSVSLSIFMGALYAISDEIHQGFVGFFDTGIFGGIRNPDPLDFIADLTGLIIISFIYIIYKSSTLKINLQE